MANPPEEAGSRPGRRILMEIGAAGLLAGLLGFGLGEWTSGFFPVEQVGVALGGGTVMRPTLETIARADMKNSALTFGVMGGLLGLTLGVAGGLVSRSTASAARGGLVGLFLGAVLGVSLPLGLIEPFDRFQADRNSDDLLAPIALHAILWAPLGAVGGLAFGVGRARPGMILRSTLGGLLGAVLGTIAYDVIGATLTPLAGTSESISRTWPTRLLARLLLAVGTVGGIALSAPAPASPAKTSDVSGPDTTPDGGP